MNPRYAKFLVISSFLLLSTPVFAASDIMKPFPLAEKGFKRMVIHLQPLENEDNYKIELMIGKILKVDCNRHWFIGHLSEEIAKGWGFAYFVLTFATGPTSTMMACPPGQKEQDTFVKVQSDQGLVRYNSKLPVVVYVPDDFDVHYRIWTAKEELGVAKME